MKGESQRGDLIGIVAKAMYEQQVTSAREVIDSIEFEPN